MSEEKIDFIQDFREVSNCKIICRNNETICTHKIILAVSGTFMRDLIKDIPVADEVTLFMKDFMVSEVLDILDTETPDPLMKAETLLFPITKLEPEQIKEETGFDEEEDEVEEDEETEELSDLEYLSSDCREEKKVKKRKVRTKAGQARQQERRGRPQLEKQSPKSAEEIAKLSENLIAAPATEDDVKNNEYWDKVVRYERALADLAQGSTLRKAAEKYQLNKTNLQRFSRQCSPLSLVELLHYCALIGRELHSDACDSNLTSYAIQNQ